MRNDDAGIPAAPPQRDFLPRFGAGCLLLLGMLVFAIGAGVLFSPHDGGIGSATVPLLIGLGFGAAGIFWLRYVFSTEKRRRDEFEEKSVLGVAARHGGNVTLAQITLESALSASEAQHALDRLCRKSLAYPDVLEDGTITYRFSGLLDR